MDPFDNPRVLNRIARDANAHAPNWHRWWNIDPETQAEIRRYFRPTDAETVECEFSFHADMDRGVVQWHSRKVAS